MKCWLPLLLLAVGCDAEVKIDTEPTPASGDTAATDGGGTDGGDTDGGGTDGGTTDGGSTGGTTDGGATADTGETGDTGAAEPDACEEELPAPVSYGTTSGWSGAEDFTIDGEGYLVSVEAGNLTRRSRAGEVLVVRPGVGTAAGIHMLNEQEVVYADVNNNTIVRVDLYSGAAQTILSGLSYPNGIEVGLDGMVYVAEHGGGRILQVDPDTGAAEVLATDMYAPNGIAFGPEHQTLYWNSFGDGSVHAVTRDGDGWTEPVLFGSTPDSSSFWDAIVAPCGGKAIGESCYDERGGIGTCGLDFGGEIDCQSLNTELACAGAEVGDVCSQELFGVTVESTCQESGSPISPSLSCPTVSAEALAVCDGAEPMTSCVYGDVAGACMPSWEGYTICVDLAAYAEELEAVCEGQEEYTPCQIGGDFQPFSGACQYSMGDGGEVLTCQQPGGSGSRGGLDGLNVDECGNVYVTEYIQGYVYRFPAGGGSPELVAELPSSWIPNLHWGNGVGGWETDVLYVIDRGRPGDSDMYELAVEIGGAPEAYSPEPDGGEPDTGR